MEDWEASLNGRGPQPPQKAPPLVTADDFLQVCKQLQKEARTVSVDNQRGKN